MALSKNFANESVRGVYFVSSESIFVVLMNEQGLEKKREGEAMARLGEEEKLDGGDYLKLAESLVLQQS